jgi:DNA-directed RNA polymerase
VFLAFCFEWLGYKTEGEAWVTHIPVGMDGTCSGLQHLNALMLSEEGRSVNLLPGDKPTDIYGDVSVDVNKLLDIDRCIPEKQMFAEVWLGKVDRKVVKRPVMTTNYGATKYGFKDQLIEVVKEKNKALRTDARKHGVRDISRITWLDISNVTEWDSVSYLADHIDTSIGHLISDARLAMDFIQKTSSILAKAGFDFVWTTPTGCRIRQRYMKTRRIKVSSQYGETKVSLHIRKDSRQIDSRGSSNGSAPNFVHSFDAAHMMLTVLRCLDYGVTSFAMIHDSFATHACDIPKLNRAIRETFVEIYQTDWLTPIHEEAKAILAKHKPKLVKKLPKPPKRGTLDLQNILKSHYFFN